MAAAFQSDAYQSDAFELAGGTTVNLAACATIMALGAAGPSITRLPKGLPTAE